MSPENRSPRRRRGLAFTVAAIALLLTLGIAYLANHYPLNRPVVYRDLAEHFKYGSIGGDLENGLPVEVLKVLPAAFPEHLPPGGARDYTAFGFVQEPGHDLPIGFSVRSRFVPRAGLNCAPCHVGTWRADPSATPTVYLGMPAAQLDLGAYFQFLFACAGDDRFTADYLLPIMQAHGARLNPLDRLLYARIVIPQMKAGLLSRQRIFAPLFGAGHPAFGPGRVDTFNPYKLNQFGAEYPDGIPAEESIGTADFPAIWNRAVKTSVPRNWDGNSPRTHDRDIGAAFGAGATRESVDLAAIARVDQFLRGLPAPFYPYRVTADSAVLRRGQAVYGQSCARCHDLKGADVGRVEPLEQIGTDPGRLRSYTAKLNRLLIDYGTGYPWKLTEMRNTTGYVSQPLDGIWARAPYLHNGSVPTLWDLLTPEDRRNHGRPTFYTGHGMYDTVDVGIRADVAEINGRPSYLFDVRLPGNSNRGHSGPYYGTGLPDGDKRALIEYLKTLR